MNSKQRRTARRTALNTICPNCGEKGPHWVVVPKEAYFGLGHREDSGFWTCPKYYHPSNGRRLAEETHVMKNPFASFFG